MRTLISQLRGGAMHVATPCESPAPHLLLLYGDLIHLLLAATFQLHRMGVSIFLSSSSWTRAFTATVFILRDTRGSTTGVASGSIGANTSQPVLQVQRLLHQRL
jgi:hypothetical protein